MERRTKVVLAALAIVAFSLLVALPKGAGETTQANSGAQKTQANQGGTSGSSDFGQETSNAAVYDGCQDSAAQVTGIDPITGAACYDITPLG